MLHSRQAKALNLLPLYGDKIVREKGGERDRERGRGRERERGSEEGRERERE